MSVEMAVAAPATRVALRLDFDQHGDATNRG
jgi:hypothetical protein